MADDLHTVWMQTGRVEQAAALAVKIGEAIKMYNGTELSRVDVLSDPRSMWTKFVNSQVSPNPESLATLTTKSRQAC